MAFRRICHEPPAGYAVTALVYVVFNFIAGTDSKG